MERYEAYKDSGVEWIGEIPEAWESIATKRLLSIANGSDPTTEGCVPVYGSSGVAFKTCGESKEPPCVLLGRKGTVDSPSYIDTPYWNVDTAFDAKPISDELALKYYFYLANCFDYGKYQTATALPSMTQTDYGNMQIPLPNPIEQRAIADYLDAKTAEIDALVDDCEREVELLQEYRKAVISEAVTKGLDPTVPMKDSGIEWIGEIPQGWRVIRVKFLANRLNVGVVINPSTYYDDNGTIPFLKGSNIQGESFDLSDVSMITEENNKLLCKTQIHTGDIVMVRVGDPGRSVVVPPELNGANVASMLEVTCGDAVIPEYLCRVFNSHLSALQVGLYTYGAAMKQINVSDLAEFYIPIPENIEEQELMIAELNRKTAEIDSLIEAKQQMADKLREYRKSLISEAVTGKFKVPGVR